MDAYPDPFLEENCPLVVFSGLLDQSPEEDADPPLPRNGIRLTGVQPLIAQDQGRRILGQAHKLGPTAREPFQRSPTSSLPPLRIQACGREYRFPTRKSSPQATPAGALIDQVVSGASSELHSPLSPLSPGSPLHPDGLMTPRWMLKHRDMIPSLLVSFFTLSSDKGLQTVHDNQMKAEINSIKTKLDDSKYRTRYAVVIVGEHTVEDDPDLDDRLSTIRRTVKLDSRSPTFFYLPLSLTDEALLVNLRVMFDALWPGILEYYKDLTRHARRKRDRGAAPVSSPPATPGVSQTLTRASWNARYEFKLGVFADYRREPDVATRHYTAALDHLFHPAGTFEVINSWSPRWDQARLFADVIAIRFLRCQLLNGLPTSTVLFWRHYKNRMADVLDRRGKGTSNYGFRAWEARWAEIMAELIRQSGPPARKDSQSAESALEEHWSTVHLAPEKQIQSDDPLHPWDLLHHAGYWFRTAIGYVRARRKLALEIPDEDRLPPGQSPAAAVARRAETYDTYLCPEPEVETRGIDENSSIHDEICADLLKNAVSAFTLHHQKRMANTCRVALGKHLASVRSLTEASQVLQSVWEENSWRQGQWRVLVQDLALVLHACAKELGDSTLMLATLWDLMDSRLPPVKGVDYDLMKILSTIDTSKSTDARIDGSVCNSFLSVHCFFERTSGYAGEVIPLRIIVTSRAHASTPPITLSSLAIDCEGPFERLELEHDSDGQQPSATATTTQNIVLQDVSATSQKTPGSVFAGQTNLTIPPQATITWTCQIIPREAGQIRHTSSSVQLKPSSFKLEYTESASTKVDVSLLRLLPGLRSPRTMPFQIEVLPKPPKLDIDLSKMEKVYYLNENPTFPLRLLNREEEAILATVEVRMLGADDDGFSIKWDEADDVNQRPVSEPLRWDVGRLEAGESSSKSLAIGIASNSTDTAVEVKAVYYLASDPSTAVTKFATSDAIVVRPFEANYSLHPLLHPDPWPSYFAPPPAADTAQACGITTRWSVSAALTSFASHEIIVLQAKLDIGSVTGDAVAQVVDPEGTAEPGEISLRPKQQYLTAFVLDVQRPELDERRTVACTARLAIAWRRASSPRDSKPVQSLLEVGRMGFPSGEPRVLCARNGPAGKSIGARVMVENPSMHYLSFNVSMQTDELYAFGGPKSMQINLVPMSRRAIDYRIVPLGAGGRTEDAQAHEPGPGDRNNDWLTLDVSVVDVYFNKRLEVLAAGPGVREEEDSRVSLQLGGGW